MAQTASNCKSGFNPSTKIFSSKRASVPLPQNPYLSVTDFIFSRRHTGKIAFIDASSGRHVSFPELYASVASVSSYLYTHLNVRKGDVVLLLSPNSIYFPIVALAVMSIGAILTTTNPLNTSQEIAKQIRDSKPKLAFVTRSLLDKVKLAKLDLPIVLLEEKDDEFITIEKMINEKPDLKRVREKVGQNDTATLLYSSGTTGTSKGVKNDTATLLSTIVILSKFEMGDLLGAIRDYKATYLPLVPPILVAMVNQKKPLPLGSLRRVLSGGAPLSKEVIEGFRKKYPQIEISQGYGLTESTGIGASTDTASESRKYGTAGMLSPNTEARIVDSKTGEFLGEGQVGELWLRSPTVMKGYFGNEEATKGALDEEGWLKTGDLCYIDEDGLLFIVDRLKELIKYKGYQVAPAELEALLLTHPKVADAAVIPFPDETVGQFPMAYIVRKAENDLSGKEVMEFIGKQVAPYKKIRRVAFVPSIPKNASGKILRKDLIKLATSTSKI